MRKLMNNLDERQENQLLHIEKNGCWLAFWALIASVFIQQVFFGITDIQTIAGEYIILLCLAIYLAVGCVKNGIWDRHLKADPKTNMITSAVAAILASIAFALVNYRSYQDILSAVATFVVMVFSVFIICFLALSSLSLLYKKRVKKMEDKYDEVLAEK